MADADVLFTFYFLLFTSYLRPNSDLLECPFVLDHGRRGNRLSVPGRGLEVAQLDAVARRLVQGGKAARLAHVRPQHLAANVNVKLERHGTGMLLCQLLGRPRRLGATGKVG